MSPVKAMGWGLAWTVGVTTALSLFFGGLALAHSLIDDELWAMAVFFTPLVWGMVSLIYYLEKRNEQ